MTESVLLSSTFCHDLSDNTMYSYSDDNNALSVMLSLSDNTMCSYSDDNSTLSVMLSLSDNTICSYSDDNNTLFVMIYLTTLCIVTLMITITHSVVR
jgi:hypothetical protein